MAKVLTEVAVQKSKPHASKRLEVPDGAMPGLYLIIQPSGRKSWAVRYRRGRTPRKLTLSPSYPALGLGDAREMARAALRQVSEGRDPAQEKRAHKHLPPADIHPDRDLVKNVIADFLKKHMAGKRSFGEVERMFNVNVLPIWGERRIRDITKRDVLDLLDGLTDRKVGTMANRVFAAVRKLFNWAVEREIVSTSPCSGLKPPAAEVSRDRVLADEEISWFWQACDDTGFPFGPLFKLLLLTGQRLSEVAEMTAGELKAKDRLWIIPKERAKNNSAHDVPLSDLTLELLAGLPRIKGKAGYLFTTTGNTPVSGFSRAKANLDEAIRAIARKEAGDKKLAIPAWRLHDLRRTTASGMARLGINLPVIEKVLAHTSGSFSGIVGVYQRHSFADEKRKALDAWANFIRSLVETRESNVVSFGAAPR